MKNMLYAVTFGHFSKPFFIKSLPTLHSSRHNHYQARRVNVVYRNITLIIVANIYIWFCEPDSKLLIVQTDGTSSVCEDIFSQVPKSVTFKTTWPSRNTVTYECKAFRYPTCKAWCQPTQCSLLPLDILAESSSGKLQKQIRSISHSACNGGQNVRATGMSLVSS